MTEYLRQNQNRYSYPVQKETSVEQEKSTVPVLHDFSDSSLLDP
jgi:hypothetical protein